MEQTETLLRTKLFTPALRTNLIPRPRLLEKLTSGLDKPVTLVSAPAGYGKTTLISTWLQSSGLPCAWLSLDENDNDPIRFLQYFLAALNPIIPTIGLDLLDIVKGVQANQFESLASLLINEIEKNSLPFILVIDDFHVIHAQNVLELLTFFLCHMPQQMHLVLLSRSDPPLPLARLRARNQLLDVRADHLRFTLPEIVSFLNEGMGLNLSEDDIAAMAVRTEGWIAGLQLAALSMQGCQDLHAFVLAFAGSHYYIMDYLVEEVLRVQPPEVSTFLLQTSILERMCASVCDALIQLNGTTATESQSMLEYLEQKNLFVIPQDNERRWYRYHHLFLEVLNRRLESLYPDILPKLHLYASLWYEQNDYFPQAIQHALKAGNQERAARLVEANGCFLLMSGEVITLLDWIKAIGAHAQSSPWIIIQKAWALTLAGILDQVEPTLRSAEQLIAAQKEPAGYGTMTGTIAAGRAFLASVSENSPSAIKYARQALQLLTDGDPLSLSMRSVANLILGEAMWLNGDLAEARRIYEEAVGISRSANNVPILISNSIDLAGVLIEQGHLHQAGRILSDLLQLAILPDGRNRSTAGRIYQKLCTLHYQWNELEQAQDDVRRWVSSAEQWQDHLLLCDAQLMQARLDCARGELDSAQQALRSAEQKMNACRLSSAQAIRLKAAIARQRLALRDAQWATSFLALNGVTIEGKPEQDEISYVQEIIDFVFLRLLLNQGDHEQALLLCGRLLSKAENEGRLGKIIEALVLRALAHRGKHETSQAMADLDRALSLAQPEGYVRAFLDEGEPLLQLLIQAQGRPGAAAYGAELLAAMGGYLDRKEPSSQPLLEPLSPREIEVLNQIQAGLSNQDIAGNLFISVPTVKRHISNIYTKLGVENRTQAVSVSRALHLIQ